MKSQSGFVASKFEKKVQKLNSASAMQNAIGYALAQLLDTTPGDNDYVPKLTIKQVFAGSMS
jgi:hypothetical protein